jgi:hypothetical protein
MPTKTIVAIRHENGFAYIAATQCPGLGSHQAPSQACVLEDGIPLPGPANSPHEDIRRLGEGRYSFWHDSVYFATRDNSDPRTNGHCYAFTYESSPGNGSATRIPFLRRWSGRPVAHLVKILWGPSRMSEALWGTLYWGCFAYVLFRKNMLSWLKRG